MANGEKTKITKYLSRSALCQLGPKRGVFFKYGDPKSVSESRT